MNWDFPSRPYGSYPVPPSFDGKDKKWKPVINYSDAEEVDAINELVMVEALETVEYTLREAMNSGSIQVKSGFIVAFVRSIRLNWFSHKLYFLNIHDWAFIVNNTPMFESDLTGLSVNDGNDEFALNYIISYKEYKEKKLREKWSGVINNQSSPNQALIIESQTTWKVPDAT